MILYFVLINAPYPDDRVSSSCEESVQRWVQLKCIHPVSIILLHLISNDIGHLPHRGASEYKPIPNPELYFNHMQGALAASLVCRKADNVWGSEHRKRRALGHHKYEVYTVIQFNGQY